MKILINGNEANVTNPVGSNIYALEVLKQLSRDSKNKYRVLLKNPQLAHLPEENAGFSYSVFGPKPLWTQFALPLRTMSEKADILFSPGHYGAGFSAIPQIISIMDLAFLRFENDFTQKDLLQLKSWTARSVRKAKKIIAISESTKKDLIRFYGLADERVKVIYPGLPKIEHRTWNSEYDSNKTINSRFKVQGSGSVKLTTSKFLLFIGTLQPRKNITNLIHAFEKVLKFDSSLKLLIAGQKGWLYDDIFSLVKQKQLEAKITFAGYVSENEKQKLLSKAEALIYPSLYEGFGFPILEAFSAGCPVVCSDNSSLPEVGGEACLYIKKPFDDSNIAQTIVKMLKLDKTQRQKLTEKGKKQLARFSWDKAGQETVELFKEVKENANI